MQIKLTAISLFSGTGVADVGLEQAGFELVLAVEREKWIADNYRANLGDHIVCDKVGNVDFSNYKNVDLVFLSPPCQQDSNCRSKHLPKHKDASVILEAIDALMTIKPQYIILENVPGFRHNPACQEFRKVLIKNGYHIAADIIDCADYGVPQHRKRLIIRARKSEKDIPPLPLKILHTGWYRAIASKIEDNLKTDEVGFPNGGNLRLVPTSLAPWQKKKLKSLWGDNLILSGNYLIPRAGCRHFSLVSEELPSPTIRALGHDQHWHQFDFLHNFNFYALTPRLEARLMTLPDNFILPDTNWKAKRIIGNSFPSLMAQKLAISFFDNTTKVL